MPANVGRSDVADLTETTVPPVPHGTRNACRVIPGTSPLGRDPRHMGVESIPPPPPPDTGADPSRGEGSTAARVGSVARGAGVARLLTSRGRGRVRDRCEFAALTDRGLVDSAAGHRAGEIAVTGRARDDAVLPRLLRGAWQCGPAGRTATSLALGVVRPAFHTGLGCGRVVRAVSQPRPAEADRGRLLASHRSRAPSAIVVAHRAASMRACTPGGRSWCCLCSWRRAATSTSSTVRVIELGVVGAVCLVACSVLGWLVTSELTGRLESLREAPAGQPRRVRRRPV